MRSSLHKSSVVLIAGNEIKGYLRYKTILCYKAALDDVYLMIFFFYFKEK